MVHDLESLWFVLSVEQNVHKVDSKVGMREQVVVDVLLRAQDLIVDVVC
tara:strand:- start:7862 stop:8008 length:147 start_codon:yes stop_codon:yes gene_type:complete